MTPRIKATVSSSAGKAYPPLEPATLNSDKPHKIKNEHFEGEIYVYCKDTPEAAKSPFFQEREEGTYGIVVKGRFLSEVSADDVVFGNVFDRPIRDQLPWGTSIAVKFGYFVDPSLTVDIYNDQPWALSPLVATMSQLSLPSSSKPKSTELKAAIQEDALEAFVERVPEAAGLPSDLTSPAARRKFFTNQANREALTFTPDMDIHTEFGNGFIDFESLSVALPPPFKLHIPLLPYWKKNPQPVTYVCQLKPKEGLVVGGEPGPVGGDNVVFWSVRFDIDEHPDAVDAEEPVEVESQPEVQKKSKADEKVEISDDVD